MKWEQVFSFFFFVSSFVWTWLPRNEKKKKNSSRARDWFFFSIFIYLDTYNDEANRHSTHTHTQTHLKTMAIEDNFENRFICANFFVLVYCSSCTLFHHFDLCWAFFIFISIHFHKMRKKKKIQFDNNNRMNLILNIPYSLHIFELRDAIEWNWDDDRMQFVYYRCQFVRFCNSEIRAFNNIKKYNNK